MVNSPTDNDTGRIEAFSDGVFAIAITLLIIEIRVPHLDHAPAGASLAGRLLELWPSYLGYMISFIVIGTIWANHHNRFSYIVRSNHVLLFLNVVFLMCVAFIPFPTALLAEYIRQPEYRTTAIAVYSGTLAVTAIFFTLLWLYAANGYRLVTGDLDPAVLKAMTGRYIIGMVLYLAAFGLAFVNIWVSLAVIFGLALLFVGPEPTIRSSSRTGDPDNLSEDNKSTE